MNRHFWTGVITGITTLTVLRLAALAAVTALLRSADMAEPRTWTAHDDDEWRDLLADVNGQQP